MINQENNDLYDLNEALQVENLTLNDFYNLLNNKNSRFAGIDGSFYFNNSIIERDLDILEIDNGYAYKIN